MPKFTVELEFPPPRRLAESVAAQLRKARETDIRFIDRLEDGGIVVRLDCESADAARAVEAALLLVRTRLSRASDAVANHPVCGVRATPNAAYDRFVPVMGIAEIAVLFDVSRQRASVLARKASFPKPIQTLRMGPVFSERSVLRYWNHHHFDDPRA